MNEIQIISAMRMENNVKNAKSSFFEMENLSEVPNIFVGEFGNFWIDQF